MLDLELIPSACCTVLVSTLKWKWEKQIKPAFFFFSESILFSFVELKLPAVCTVEAIGVIRIIFENERLFINNGMALLANVLPQASGFFPVVARMAEMSEII